MCSYTVVDYLPIDTNYHKYHKYHKYHNFDAPPAPPLSVWMFILEYNVSYDSHQGQPGVYVKAFHQLM